MIIDTAHSDWKSPELPLLSVNVQTVTETRKKLRPIPLLIGLFLLIVYQTIDAGMTHVLEILFRSADGTPNWVWLVALLSVLVNLIFPLMISFWLLFQLKKPHDGRREFELLVIEHLRAWGHTLTWSFLFIIPGFYKWMSYAFVPFVVLFSKKYRDGEVDALKHSTALFRKTWWKIVPVILVFALIIPFFITTSFDQYREIWVTPVGAILLGMTDFGFLILSLTISFFVFRNSIREVNDELVF